MQPGKSRHRSKMRSEYASAKVPLGNQNDYVRLHITPLDSELINTIIPAAVLPSARNLSFHTLDNFPEKRYGFVDLPRADADKLKKKLNGSLLKGSKIRIEKARPETRIEPTGFAEELSSERKHTKNASKTSKRYEPDLNVLEGFTLSGRRVKRGWTEPLDTARKKSMNEKYRDKEKRKRQKSKYTDQAECLLQIKMPPNAVSNLSQDGVSNSKSKKGRKMRAARVHEFEKTTRFPGFLKHSTPEATTTATEFVEGTGWVDENGDVVEAMASKGPAALTRDQRMTRSQGDLKSKEKHDDSTSSSGTSSEEGDETDSEVDERVKKKHRQRSASQVEHKSVETEDDQASAVRHASPIPVARADEFKRSSSTDLTVKSPAPATPATGAVHPLEALYKKPKPDANEEGSQKQTESFHFFGERSDEEGKENEEEEEEEHGTEKPAGEAAPMTPFTQRDFEWRKVRSAAPTPDTAHASRKHTLGNHSARDGDDGNSRTEMAPRAAEKTGLENAAPQDQTDFQTWFWANRSELIRSWKSRRKAALKEKRYSDNKARAFRAL